MNEKIYPHEEGYYWVTDINEDLGVAYISKTGVVSLPGNEGEFYVPDFNYISGKIPTPTDEDTSRNIIEGLKSERDEAIKMLRKLNDAIDSCIELTPSLLQSVQKLLNKYKTI